MAVQSGSVAGFSPSGQDDVSDIEALDQIVENYFARIAFDLDGTILSANANFLNTLGYTASEVVGKHHRIFVDEAYRNTEDYKEFWERLALGDVFTGQFPRITKDGNTVWIQATYAPVTDEHGTPVRVVKLASDVTKRRSALEKVSQGLNALAAGDLSVRADVDPDNELYDLAKDYNACRESLSQVIGVVSQVTNGLGSAAQSLLSTAEASLEHTRQNAEDLQRVASEVSATSESVVEASTVADECQSFANNAASVAGVAVEKMNDATAIAVEMRRAVDQMAGINSVIESIAFQTNMLALNAGVEAARAGPAGAGFAVVATEIRSLATRSNEASSEIKQLIDLTMAKSEGTRDCLQSSGSKLRELEEATTALAGKVLTISGAARTQSEQLTGIDRKVQHLSSSVQTELHSATANSDSAKELSEYGKRLSSELSRFSAL